MSGDYVPDLVSSMLQCVELKARIEKEVCDILLEYSVSIFFFYLKHYNSKQL